MWYQKRTHTFAVIEKKIKINYLYFKKRESMVAQFLSQSNYHNNYLLNNYKK